MKSEHEKIQDYLEQKGYSPLESARESIRAAKEIEAIRARGLAGKDAAAVRLLPTAHTGIMKTEIVLLPMVCGTPDNRACIDCGEWAASGGSRCEDCQEDKELD